MLQWASMHRGTTLRRKRGRQGRGRTSIVSCGCAGFCRFPRPQRARAPQPTPGGARRQTAGNKPRQTRKPAHTVPRSPPYWPWAWCPCLLPLVLQPVPWWLLGDGPRQVTIVSSTSICESPVRGGYARPPTDHHRTQCIANLHRAVTVMELARVLLCVYVLVE